MAAPSHRAHHQCKQGHGGRASAQDPGPFAVQVQVLGTTLKKDTEKKDSTHHIKKLENGQSPGLAVRVKPSCLRGRGPRTRASPPRKRTPSRGSAPSGPVTCRRSETPSHGHEPLTGRNRPAGLASRHGGRAGPAARPATEEAASSYGRGLAQTDTAGATRQAGPLDHRPKTGCISR